MARQARKNLDSNLILITQTSRLDLFRDDSDRDVFLKILQKVQVQYGCTILAFCCGEKRGFKLIIDTQGANISRIMQTLSIAYALHRKSDQKIFQQRYKSKALKHDDEIQPLVQAVGTNTDEYASCCYMKDDSYPWLKPIRDLNLKHIFPIPHNEEPTLLETWLKDHTLQFEELLKNKSLRNQAIQDLRRTGNCSLKRLALVFHLTESSISKIINKA